MSTLLVRQLGVQPYEKVWRAMSRFTDERIEHTQDELWLVQHQPVFTQGQAGNPEHLLSPGDIPVIQTDRGGQVTYHGPGQLVAYPLIDLRRRKLGVRDMVTLLEEVVIDLLAGHDVDAYAKADAPGVYVRYTQKSKLGPQPLAEAKVASLGLRVRRGCCFHGLSLNVDMDLSPFNMINPCGYAGLSMTQVADLLPETAVDYVEVEQSITGLIAKKLQVAEVATTAAMPQMMQVSE